MQKKLTTIVDSQEGEKMDRPKNLQQLWLQTIYRNLQKYEVRIIAILNDKTIIAIADSFDEAKQIAENTMTAKQKEV